MGGYWNCQLRVAVWWQEAEKAARLTQEMDAGGTREQLGVVVCPIALEA